MLKRILSLLVVLSLVGVVSASEVWSGDGSDNNWTTPDNWHGDVPVDTYAKIQGNAGSWGNAVTIDSTNVSGDAGEVNPNKVGLGKGDTCYLTMSGGVANTKTFVVGMDAGTGYMEMTGGTLSLTKDDSDDLIIAESDGTVNAGTLTMTGGNIEVNDNLELARASGSGTGVLNLDGGTIYMNGHHNDNNLKINDNGGTGGLIDITEGTLEFEYDNTGDVQSAIDNGYITAYDGTGTVVNTYDAGTNLTTVTAVPEPATLSILGLSGLFMIRRRRK